MIDSGKRDQRTKARTLVNTSADAWPGGDNVRREKDGNEADRPPFSNETYFWRPLLTRDTCFSLMEGPIYVCLKIILFVLSGIT